MSEYRADIDGDDLVCGMFRYSGTDQMGKLCRFLKRGTLQVYRSDKLSLTVDIEKRSKQSLTENDKNGLRYVKYKPFPDKLKGSQQYHHQDGR